MELIGDYSMKPLTRFTAINRIGLQSGKTPGTDNILLKDHSDKLEIFKNTGIPKLNQLPRMEVRYVEIPKPNGKIRGLGISNIVDRVLQTQLCLLLDAYHEAKYPPHMYGFRKGRGALSAVGYLKSIMERADNHRFGMILMDIEKCFDNIRHDVILKEFIVPTK